MVELETTRGEIAPAQVVYFFTHWESGLQLDGRFRHVWRVVDATQLAPRSNLVRISTGRDAADTAFLDNHGGSITLHASEVRAVVDGVLDKVTALLEGH